MSNDKLKTRNSQTLKSYCAANNNADFQIGKNAAGNYFFICGDKRGYVSKRAINATPEQLQIAELQLPDGTWMPTLMLTGANIVRTIKFADL
jgi:hypothetical protein